MLFPSLHFSEAVGKVPEPGLAHACGRVHRRKLGKAVTPICAGKSRDRWVRLALQIWGAQANHLLHQRVCVTLSVRKLAPSY